MEPIIQAALGLFDFLPMCQVYGKDYRGLSRGEGGKFFYANTRFLQEKGEEDLAEILGKTDWDYHPAALASQYVTEDEAVFDQKTPVLDRAWVVIEPDRKARVWKSSKIPVFDEGGQRLAMMGAMYEIQGDELAAGQTGRLTRALVFINDHLGEKLSLERLARESGLSVSRFVSVFREAFGEAPGQYLKRMRVSAAAKRLLESDFSIGEIALEYGFYDHSHFTRQFREVLGVSPKLYRVSNR